jgi:hypothetical protein
MDILLQLLQHGLKKSIHLSKPTEEISKSGTGEVVEHLFRKLKALSSNPNPTKKKKRKKRNRQKLGIKQGFYKL